MPRKKSRLTLVRNMKRAGMSRVAAKEHITKTLKEAAARDGWRSSELAFGLADWYRHLDKVFGKEA